MEPTFRPVMTPGGQTSIPVQDRTLTLEPQRVLRNTYWLLALSMLPTIAGAIAGMSFNFIGLFRAAPIMTPLLMFAVMMGSLFIVTALKNSVWGVVALLGFTFIAGLMLTPILTVAAGFRNGGELVALAGVMTSVIFFAMATIATVSKRDFSFLGKFLFIGMILLIVASLANLFFAVPAVSLTISAIAVLIFSLYLLYDINSIVRGGQTNYIVATLSVFLSLFNIFISLLNLLMAFSGQRD